MFRISLHKPPSSHTANRSDNTDRDVAAKKTSPPTMLDKDNNEGPEKSSFLVSVSSVLGII